MPPPPIRWCDFAIFMIGDAIASLSAFVKGDMNKAIPQNIREPRKYWGI
jgi:hypothetical protein